MIENIPVAWLQLQFFTAGDTAARLSEALDNVGALAVTFEDAGDEPIYEPTPGVEIRWEEMVVTGLFTADSPIDTILLALHQHFPDCLPPYRLINLDDQPWERVWMDRFHPMQFGKHLWICPSWCQVPDKDAVTVLLDPGLAFGTGTHPTTSLCLRWLDGHPMKQLECLDYGCGSGILGIAAAKLGAAKVWAVDNHPQALVATRENCANNGVTAAVVTILAPPDLPPVQVDVLLANILAKPLIELAPQLSLMVKPGGHLVLSGILQNQALEVMAAYQPLFVFADVVVADEWVRLAAIKKH